MVVLQTSEVGTTFATFGAVLDGFGFEFITHFVGRL
jgi:hypothetical protein